MSDRNASQCGNLELILLQLQLDINSLHLTMKVMHNFILFTITIFVCGPLLLFEIDELCTLSRQTARTDVIEDFTETEPQDEENP
ncbi:hypothetical protein HRI_004685600 [Hibiscus trionum]|uniref:Uncharacterized protein n=1 Tax=Hibiscus trionum TaxID=183268 RepID=A0A9W7MPQ7_HIBTR|nr:hypothetical protein HRI_004685600 [Hibiscus trionum]